MLAFIWSHGFLNLMNASLIFTHFWLCFGLNQPVLQLCYVHQLAASFRGLLFSAGQVGLWAFTLYLHNTDESSESESKQ